MKKQYQVVSYPIPTAQNCNDLNGEALSYTLFLCGHVSIFIKRLFPLGLVILTFYAYTLYVQVLN